MTATRLTAGAAALALAALAAAAPPRGGAFEALVEQAIDGETLLVVPAGGAAPIPVRLRGVAAPLPCQSGAAEARAQLEEWVKGRSVRVSGQGRDRQGRLLAKVEHDGADVNRRLIEEGRAWSERTRWDRGPYVKEERVAAALRRGLHASTGALPPQEFLRRHGPCGP
jgi:endonuclease YncB( thermonuclease family)